MAKEYSETVIGAFLSHYKIKDIAEASGLSQRTVKRYKADPEFISVLNERRAAIIGAAVDRMTNSLWDDAGVLQEIIDNPSVNPADQIPSAASNRQRRLCRWIPGLR